MNTENLAGCIIQLLCSLICAGIFTGIAIWARRAEKPVSFYSGTTVEPDTVSDIPAYNKENSKMWMIYSVPYWLSCISSIIGFFWNKVILIGIISLMGAGTLGIGWLLLRYKSISNRYIIR